MTKAAEASKEEEAKARKRAETISEFVTTALKAGDAWNSGIAGAGEAGAAVTVGAGQDMTILAAMDNAVKDIDSGRFKDDPETEAGLRDTIGVILRNNGKYDKSKPLLEQALAIRERLYKADQAGEHRQGRGPDTGNARHRTRHAAHGQPPTRRTTRLVGPDAADAEGVG